MAIRYPKEVREFIQAELLWAPPGRTNVLVNKNFLRVIRRHKMKSYVKREIAE